jgi:energy-coupling factor transport system substrate-specific component
MTAAIETFERAHAVSMRAGTWLILAVGSAAGLAMFLWPLLTSAPEGTAPHTNDAPYAFVVILPLLVAVLLAEVSGGGIDVKAIAMLGVLTGVGAALRPLSPGIAGIETTLFLIVLAGRVYGPGFGFVLGSTTLFGSALLTGGVGPWLPFQMLASAWVGLGAGLLPRCRGRAEIALLAAYSAVAAYAFGFLLNMWFWPFAAGSTTAAEPGLQFVPGDAVFDNLRRFVLYTVATSTLGWDTGRALTNVAAIAFVGAPVLATLRRASRKARFTPSPLRERSWAMNGDRSRRSRAGGGLSSGA